MTQTQISPLAYVHPEARLGSGVVVEPFAYVAGDVVVGDHCWIGPHAVVQDGARIGHHCRIFSGAVVSSIPQDLKFTGEYTTTEIGDRVTIREFATINRGTVQLGKTVLGAEVLVMAYVHIAHDCIIHPHTILSNAVNIAGHVEIEEFTVVGGLSAVHQFSKIGRHAMIAGGSIVRKDVPPYALVGKSPLIFVGVNTTGLKRRQFAPEAIRTIQDIYRTLYHANLNNTDALAVIEEQFPPSIERDHILAFVRQSDRGILRAAP